jgi:hypothetical protein
MTASKGPVRIPLSEFAADPTTIFERVTRDHIAVLIEDAAGARAELRPAGTDGWLTDADISLPPTSEEVERSRAGTQAGAGSWRGLVDTDAFKAYLAERRRIKTRARVRL